MSAPTFDVAELMAETPERENVTPKHHKHIRLLFFWTKEKRTLIIPISNIPEEDQEKGKCTRVEWSKTKIEFTAKVIKISGKLIYIQCIFFVKTDVPI